MAMIRATVQIGIGPDSAERTVSTYVPGTFAEGTVDLDGARQAAADALQQSLGDVATSMDLPLPTITQEIAP